MRNAAFAANPPRRVLMTADPLGGVWTYAMELARALGPFGVEVVLAALGGPVSAAQRREAAEIAHLCLHEKRARLEWMEEPWADVDRSGEWLLALAEECQPDCVHLNGYSHAALPWERPVVVAAHSCVFSWWKAVHGVEPPARFETYRRRVQAGLRAATLVVAPTAAMLDALGAAWEIDPAKTRVIWNARDPGRFGAEAKQPVILAAGRLWDAGKNIALLEEIAPALEWEVLLAEGAREPERSVVPESGGNGRGANLRPLGQLDAAALRQRLATAAIFAAPARYEPFGLSVLEAALSGCALVLADIPSFRELWEGCAVHVDPNRPGEWREAIAALIADPRRRQRLGAEARARALRHAPERMARETLSVYRQAGIIVAARRRGGPWMQPGATEVLSAPLAPADLLLHS